MTPSENGNTYQFEYSQSLNNVLSVEVKLDLPDNPEEFKHLDLDYGDLSGLDLGVIFNKVPVPLSQFDELYEDESKNRKSKIRCLIRWLATTNSIYASETPLTAIEMDIYDPINDGNRLNDLELANGETYQLVTHLYTNTGLNPDVTLMYDDGTAVNTIEDCTSLHNDETILSCDLFVYDDSSM